MDKVFCQRRQLLFYLGLGVLGFLADRRGLMRYDRIGEGAYDTTEQTIQQLLKEN